MPLHIVTPTIFYLGPIHKDYKQFISEKLAACDECLFNPVVRRCSRVLTKDA